MSMYQSNKRKPRTFNRDVSISKTLSYILRHKAIDMGYRIDEEGYVLVDEILNRNVSLKKMKATIEDVKNAVETNEKQRFSLLTKNNQLYIRANQGHSFKSNILKDELMLREIKNADEVECCVHGTYMKSWPLIETNGLSIMKRRHIHFASKDFGDASMVSGMRKTVNVLIYINLKLALQDNIKFFMSENEVILTDGVDGYLKPKYFKKVVEIDRQGKSKILLESKE